MEITLHPNIDNSYLLRCIAELRFDCEKEIEPETINSERVSFYTSLSLQLEYVSDYRDLLELLYKLSESLHRPAFEDHIGLYYEDPLDDEKRELVERMIEILNFTSPLITAAELQSEPEKLFSSFLIPWNIESQIEQVKSPIKEISKTDQARFWVSVYKSLHARLRVPDLENPRRSRWYSGRAGLITMHDLSDTYLTLLRWIEERLPILNWSGTFS